MFCFQCEQTVGCTGCTGNAGVCGKKADTAKLQDELTGALISLAKAADSTETISKRTGQIIIEGLFTTVTNVSFDNAAIENMNSSREGNHFCCKYSVSVAAFWRHQTVGSVEDRGRKMVKFFLLILPCSSEIAFPGAVHIDEKKDFTPVIEKALELGGYKEDQMFSGINGGKKVTTGFGHAAILSHAGTVVEAVKSGAIRHFFLVAGCDRCNTIIFHQIV